MDQESLKESVNRIRVKAAMLRSRYLAEKERNALAQQRIAALEDEVVDFTNRVERLKADIEVLRMASVLSPGHRDVEATRSKLSSLVREIDKCINLLSH